MPSPFPATQSADASVMLPVSSTVPSVPTARLPTAWVRADLGLPYLAFLVVLPAVAVLFVVRFLFAPARLRGTALAIGAGVSGASTTTHKKAEAGGTLTWAIQTNPASLFDLSFILKAMLFYFFFRNQSIW